MRTFGLAWLIFVVVCGANCVPSFDDDGSTPVDPKTVCTSDANCDDKNPCTVDTCQSDRTCSIVAVSDGPLPQQTAGDCIRDDCKAGQSITVQDDADIPDDNEPCTTDTCNNGAPVHAPLANDTMCAMGTSPGKCAAGVCQISCSPSKPCDDMNPCTEDSCNASLGTCAFVPIDGLPTPGFQEPVGDCKLHICASGMDTPLNDDADIPVDNNPCTQDVCANGIGSNPGLTAGTPCILGLPDVCDGAGACVECVVPRDCVNLPVDDDCQQRTCIGNMCGQTFAAMGTPTVKTPAQKSGDCNQVVCNGTGGTLVIPFDTDLPEDNNPCTKNICTKGVPSNPNEASGFSCGSPLICDGVGRCVGCNQPADCVFLPPDDFCKKRVCTNQTCSLQLAPSGTDLPTGQTSQDCHVLECDANGNIVDAVDTADVPVDGNQCTRDVCSMAGAPSNPNQPINTACMQSGGTVCNGAGTCKKADGATCAGTTDCLSGFCVDGVCCNSTCGTLCKSCNVAGSIGTCVNVPTASEDLPGCSGVNSCDGAGACKKDDGQTCTVGSDCVSAYCVDGVCCGSACAGTCMSCNLSDTAGICSDIPAGTDPDNECDDAAPNCNGSGACK